MPKINIVRQQESELPATVSVQFINKNADYQQGLQEARRMLVKSTQKVTIQSPIVFNDLEARNIAQKLMYNVWVERDRFTIRLPRKYAYLEPTDVFDIVDPVNKFQYSVRIVKKTESRTGALELECVAEHAPIYRQNMAAQNAETVPQTNPVSSGTQAILLDLPTLREQDSGLGWYVALSGRTDTWAGGTLYQSVDNGNTYSLYESTTTAAVIGAATTALDTWDAFAGEDINNAVNVRIISGELQSVTLQAIANGANLAALKTAGGWEVFQFRTATLQPGAATDPDVYRLSNLTRGRFGTEWATIGHAVGDTFVLLDTANVQRGYISNQQLNVPLMYKAVTLAQPLGGVTASTIANTGVAFKPYSVIDIAATATTNAAKITFTRRLRVGEVSTDPQQYVVEIWSPNFASIKRSITGLTAPEALYTNDQQIQDFGTEQGDLYVRVYQINPVVGRGYPAQSHVTITGEVVGGGNQFTASILEAANAQHTQGSNVSILTTNMLTVSSTIAPLQGAGSLGTLMTGDMDDGAYRFDVPFPFKFLGIDYGNGGNGGLYVGSNSYITFGAGSTAYNVSSNGLDGKGFVVTADDRSVQRIYAGLEDRVYRVRFEGTNSPSGIVGSPDIVWEMSFFPSGQVMLVVGQNAAVGTGQSGVMRDATILTQGSFGTNLSYVFTPRNASDVPANTGDNWAIQLGSISY